MVQINRKAWLLFDIIGLVFVVFGAMSYVGLLFHTGTFVGLSAFLMGLFFVVLGSAFGYLEGITVRDEISELVRSKNVEEAVAKCNDGEGTYILDIDEAEKKAIPDEINVNELFDDNVDSKK
jgi:hypothetical protein